MSGDVATLARRFAHALEQRRTSWDQQYVSRRPLPLVADEPPAMEADAEPSAGEEPRPVSVARSPESAASARSPEPTPAVAPIARSPEPDAIARSPEPTPVARPPEPAPVARPPESAAPLAPAAPPPQATRARREALREQAQHWTAATKLEYLRRHNVGDCQRCPLARTRNQIVFGVGHAEADVMFVGEAPGADEDRQGEPFVGRAGQLLNRWLTELGLSRDEVYISNVLKCRPPGNRDPRPEEVERCSPFLQAQIRAIEPKVIVALGRHAGMLLSRREELTLRAMRGARLHYDAGASKDDPSVRIRIPLVVTYHPAYVLRQEGDGQAPTPGRPSPTEMVMSDLRRALAIARDGGA